MSREIYKTHRENHFRMFRKTEKYGKLNRHVMLGDLKGVYLMCFYNIITSFPISLSPFENPFMFALLVLFQIHGFLFIHFCSMHICILYTNVFLTITCLVCIMWLVFVFSGMSIWHWIIISMHFPASPTTYPMAHYSSNSWKIFSLIYIEY